MWAREEAFLHISTQKVKRRLFCSCNLAESRLSFEQVSKWNVVNWSMFHKPGATRKIAGEIGMDDVWPHLNAWVSVCSQLMEYVSHMKTPFCGFSFYNAEKETESLVNIKRNNDAFVPWPTGPPEGNRVSSEDSSTQNLQEVQMLDLECWECCSVWLEAQEDPHPQQTSRPSSCFTFHQNKNIKCCSLWVPVSDLVVSTHPHWSCGGAVSEGCSDQQEYVFSAWKPPFAANTRPEQHRRVVLPSPHTTDLHASAEHTHVCKVGIYHREFKSFFFGLQVGNKPNWQMNGSFLLQSLVASHWNPEAPRMWAQGDPGWGVLTHAEKVPERSSPKRAPGGRTNRCWAQWSS